MGGGRAYQRGFAGQLLGCVGIQVMPAYKWRSSALAEAHVPKRTLRAVSKTAIFGSA